MQEPLGAFERWLSLWVALCIVAGIGMGALAPALFQALAALEYAKVNLVVAVLIWVMLSLLAFANRTQGRFPPA